MNKRFFRVVIFALFAGFGFASAAHELECEKRAGIVKLDATGHPMLDPATGLPMFAVAPAAVLAPALGEVGRTVRITEPGGILGNVGHWIPGVPQFAADREAVVFLYGAPGNRLRVLGLGQGVYNVFRDPTTGDLLARPSLETREIVYEQGRSLARAPGEILNTRKLGEFLFLIRRRASIR